jgi:hypothetical protein
MFVCPHAFTLTYSPTVTITFYNLPGDGNTMHKVYAHILQEHVSVAC